VFPPRPPAPRTATREAASLAVDSPGQARTELLDHSVARAGSTSAPCCYLPNVTEDRYRIERMAEGGEREDCGETTGASPRDALLGHFDGQVPDDLSARFIVAGPLPDAGVAPTPQHDFVVENGIVG